MPCSNILAMVLAGGEGSRLRPLTNDHSKPAVSFGGRYRLVDFVLSNLVNSGVASIYLLTQYKPASLIEHVEINWKHAPSWHEKEWKIHVAPPQPASGGSYLGTADAVYQNLALIERHAPSMVAVFAADHVYRMDVRQMVNFHHECDADVSVAATQVPIEQASSFGIMATGYRGEILDFQEKPESPAAIPSSPDCAFASMGNYLFNTDVLVDALEQAARRGETDFGRHIIPDLIQSHHVHAYDFSGNCVPGTEPYEEAAYWRDVGSLEAYYAAHGDIIGSMPRFRLHNPHWPTLPALFESQRHHGIGQSRAAAGIREDFFARLEGMAGAFTLQPDVIPAGTS